MSRALVSRAKASGGKPPGAHGAVSDLPRQRAAVAGARKRLCFMRERILDLVPAGEGYLTALIHQRPHTRKGDVERLFALQEELGEERFRLVLQRKQVCRSQYSPIGICTLGRIPGERPQAAVPGMKPRELRPYLFIIDIMSLTL